MAKFQLNVGVSVREYHTIVVEADTAEEARIKARDEFMIHELEHFEREDEQTYWLADLPDFNVLEALLVPPGTPASIPSAALAVPDDNTPL